MRDSFKSRLGFLLVSAGCAIGIGNVWKFPYVAGQNGGGIFVLFYFLFLIIMGVPVLTMELAVGRAGRSSAVGAFKKLEKPGHIWHYHGWLGMGASYLLMMYYTTVSGWMLCYFFKYLTGGFSGVQTVEQIKAVFTSLTSSTLEMSIWMIITVVLGFAVCIGGVAKSLEKVNKVMMLALFGLIIILVVNSFTLNNAKEGLSFLLLPDIDKANEVGWINVITAAMSQAFFTLSLGVGSMQIFGSYMPKNNTLGGEAVRICVLDTFVAVASGLIIFPACFSFGVEPTAGPPLIFEALPSVFANMAGGRIWGSLFFLFMTFASFSTVTAVFQNIVAACEENFGWGRKKTIIFNTLFMIVASLPCVLGFNLLSGANIPGLGNILDIEDFIVSNLILPIGTLIFVLFCATKYGWGFDRYTEEVNTGKGLRMPKHAWYKTYLQIIMPILILVILISGLL